MNLRDYLHFERITIKKFAESIDYAPGHLYGYLQGRLKLSKKAARIIERVTVGKVTAKEIMHDNPDKKKIYKK